MTTDPHEQILARLDRVIELLEDIRDARKSKLQTGGIINNPRPFADTTGCVTQGTQRPEDGVQVHIDPHHVIGATIHELRRQGKLR